MQKTILPVSMLVLALLRPQAAMFGAAVRVPPDHKDPQYQKAGDQNRTYMFPGTGESIPYHLYVHTTWTKKTKLPLLIFLHGPGQTPESPFHNAQDSLSKLAEQRGYIVAGVLGYRPNGDFNNPF